jgi:hypothetical protein
MNNPSEPPSESRVLEMSDSLNSESGEGSLARPVCEGCHWHVNHTRRFRGRMLCLPCIGEYFEADGEEDDTQ